MVAFVPRPLKLRASDVRECTDVVDIMIPLASTSSIIARLIHQPSPLFVWIYLVWVHTGWSLSVRLLCRFDLVPGSTVPALESEVHK